jgi:hypothetical protein
MLTGSAQSWARQSPDSNPRGDRARAAQGRQEKQAGARPAAGSPQGKEAFLQRLSRLPADQQEKLLRNSSDFQKLPAPEQERIIDAVRHWNAAGRPPGGLQAMIEHEHAPAFFQ